MLRGHATRASAKNSLRQPRKSSGIYAKSILKKSIVPIAMPCSRLAPQPVSARAGLAGWRAPIGTVRGSIAQIWKKSAPDSTPSPAHQPADAERVHAQLPHAVGLRHTGSTGEAGRTQGHCPIVLNADRALRSVSLRGK